MVLDGHAREILSIDFAPNGYQVATASGDDTVRIWDMRALRSLYTIPAHRSSVADVRFFRAADEGEASKSNGVKMELDDEKDHVDKKEEVRLNRSGMYLATAGYDGLVKIWSADDWQLLRSLSADAGKVMSVDISSGESKCERSSFASADPFLGAHTDGDLVSGHWDRTFKVSGESISFGLHLH